MNSKYSRLELNKVTDNEGTAFDKNTILHKVKMFYQNLYQKKTLDNDYSNFLINNPKISNASKEAMEADLTLEELYNTCTGKKMKDTAPGPDGIPYSVYHKLWAQAGQLILDSWNYSIAKGELSREQQLSKIMLLEKKVKAQSN